MANRKALADQLLAHARLAALYIRGSRRGPSLTVLDAVTAAHTMHKLASQTLHALVLEARQQGHTWEEIGEKLGISRQGAQQRFGNADPSALEKLGE